jgi:hypothetical protein
VLDEHVLSVGRQRLVTEQLHERLRELRSDPDA